MRKNLDGGARNRLVIWRRRRMAEFGITPETLASSIEADAAHAPVYRNAHGNEWNGKGNMPEWLAAAKHAGVNPDFFHVSGDHERSDLARDPRQMSFLFSFEA
jgi:DNA-binding protein H-NS